MSAKKQAEKKPEKRGRGRPKTTGTNPIREVGRCSDEDWSQVQEAAKLDGKPTATWAREAVIAAAKRRLSK